MSNNITIHKINFSAPSRGLDHNEYVLGTFQQAWDYAVGEGSSLGALYDVKPVHAEGNTIQVEALIDSDIIKILCN